MTGPLAMTEYLTPGVVGPMALYWRDGGGQQAIVYTLDPDHENFLRNIQSMGPLSRALLRAHLMAVVEEMDKITALPKA